MRRVCPVISSGPFLQPHPHRAQALALLLASLEEGTGPLRPLRPPWRALPRLCPAPTLPVSIPVLGPHSSSKTQIPSSPKGTRGECASAPVSVRADPAPPPPPPSPSSCPGLRGAGGAVSMALSSGTGFLPLGSRSREKEVQPTDAGICRGLPQALRAHREHQGPALLSDARVTQAAGGAFTSQVRAAVLEPVVDCLPAAQQPSDPHAPLRSQTEAGEGLCAH